MSLTFIYKVKYSTIKILSFQKKQPFFLSLSRQFYGDLNHHIPNHEMRKKTLLTYQFHQIQKIFWKRTKTNPTDEETIISDKEIVDEFDEIMNADEIEIEKMRFKMKKKILREESDQRI
jgi:hypothetical protein